MEGILEMIYTGSEGIAKTIDNLIKPPIYQSSDMIFNTVLVAATLFSVLFYVLAIYGVFSRPKIRNNTKRLPPACLKSPI